MNWKKSFMELEPSFPCILDTGCVTVLWWSRDVDQSINQSIEGPYGRLATLTLYFQNFSRSASGTVGEATIFSLQNWRQSLMAVNLGIICHRTYRSRVSTYSSTKRLCTSCSVRQLFPTPPSPTTMSSYLGLTFFAIYQFRYWTLGRKNNPNRQSKGNIIYENYFCFEIHYREGRRTTQSQIQKYKTLRDKPPFGDKQLGAARPSQSVPCAVKFRACGCSHGQFLLIFHYFIFFHVITGIILYVSFVYSGEAGTRPVHIRTVTVTR